jgi:hypothetical protein
MNHKQKTAHLCVNRAGGAINEAGTILGAIVCAGIPIQLVTRRKRSKRRVALPGLQED